MHAFLLILPPTTQHLVSTAIDMGTENLFQQLEKEAPIHGDILEDIFSHLPLTHLLPAPHVSEEWKRALSISLRHVNPIKPWLMVHTQYPRAPHVINSYAYDPRSRAWIQIHAPPTKHSAALRSSHSTLLYTLSPIEFSFSLDPLHLAWHRARAPYVCRNDPVVASVGRYIVVAGGVYDFEDDPLAVEMYDMESRGWIRCQSMPAMLKDSTASTWLSVAVIGEKMHVTEKNSGLTYWFDCEARTWEGPYDLRPDQSVFCCVTGNLRGRLMVAGMVGDAENVKGVKLWEVKGELGFGSEYWWEELGEMPKEMVAKVKGEEGCGVVASIAVTWMGDFVYLRNPWEPVEIVVCEVVNGGMCEWGSLRNAVVNDGVWGRMVFCCGDVGLDDLQKAVNDYWRFVIKEM